MSEIHSTGGFGGSGSRSSSGRSGSGGGSEEGSGGSTRKRSRPLGKVVKQTMNDDTVRQVSTMLGTDEATARRSMAVALPTLLAGLSQEAATPQGAEALDRALARDHDGSVLDDIPGYVARGGNVADGRKILGHVLGSQQAELETRLGQKTGLQADQVGLLLAALAPLVLGALGKQKQEENLGPQGLSDLLGGGSMGGLLGTILGSGMLGGGPSSTQQSSQGSGGLLGGLLGSLFGGGKKEQQDEPFIGQQMGSSQFSQQQYSQQNAGGGMMDLLGQLLDRDEDGSGVDDMMDMLGGLLGGPRR